MKRIKNKLALIRLGNKNNILYSEYIRAQRDALDKNDLVQAIIKVLDLYKKESIKKQANRIVSELLDVGRIRKGDDYE